VEGLGELGVLSGLFSFREDREVEGLGELGELFFSREDREDREVEGLGELLAFQIEKRSHPPAADEAFLPKTRISIKCVFIPVAA
jgi:hypothetical protein